MKVLAFGIVKEIFDAPVIDIDVEQGVDIKTLKNLLEKKYPGLTALGSYMVALNNEYANADDLIHTDDEVAIIPPVSGGQSINKKKFSLNTEIKISGEVLNISNCINWVMSEACGGINAFIGTVRNQTKDKMVTRLEFEAYETMALSEMHKIAKEAFQEYNVDKILIHHRTGILFPGDIPVIIVVAAAHRDAAFMACRYIIDTLKKTVPIWKKEIFEDGEVWVAAHP